MARPFLAVAAALMLAFFAAAHAQAQSSLSERLASEKLAEVEPGTYQAGDIEFMLDRDQGHYLLRFAGSPEVFVLYADHASLGGRVLKYDSGQTVLKVTGWGGITLYTDKKPEGLPAVRNGDSQPPSLPDVSLDDMKHAASDESQHLAYMRRLNLSFSADWDKLASDAQSRALCFDALENAARGIDRFTAGAAAQKAIAAKVRAVLMAESGKPTLELKGEKLIVTYDPDNGYAGRASSRAIARALGTIFHIKTKP